MRLHIALLLLCGLGTAAASTPITYTENDSSCAGCIALGYPVPLPVAALSPGDYFRHYDSLLAQLQGLAVSSEHLQVQVIGQSFAGRDILAYLLGDADTTMADGVRIEAATLQNGGIHAREWQSPEVVTGIMEYFLDRASDGGLHQYLLENLTMVLIPVLNVDGFLQTQGNADAALGSEYPGEPNTNSTNPSKLAWPRDGRMRRKNMRGADELLATDNDFMAGVDLNRNNAPFHASGVGNENDVRSLIYRGSSAASEPEIQALQAAAALAPAERLRLYVDTHSFTRALFASYTGNSRRNAIQDALGGMLRRATGNRYCYFDNGGACRGNPSAANPGIGTTEEYFAFVHQVPSFTLEIEPGPNGSGSEYGGSGYHHDGFILPENQIARARAELARAMVLAYYRQSGPPAVVAAEIRDDSDGLVYRADWNPLSAATRELVESRPLALQAGATYTLWLAFDKPMRVRDEFGNVSNYFGQSVPLAPQLTLSGVSATGSAFNYAIPTLARDWRQNPGSVPQGYLRYVDDAVMVQLLVPENLPVADARRLTLEVEVQDASGLRLDADPATVADWGNGAWQSYENDNGVATDSGGSDHRLRLIDDGSPTFPPAPPTSGRRRGGAMPLFWLALALGVALWRHATARSA